MRCNRFPRVSLLLGLLLALLAGSVGQAQLIPPGTAVPSTTLPPVVFINGFQFEGCPSTFAGTFGIADQVLESNGEVSLFFSTCSLSSTATIEDLAGAFATFLSGLQYTNGQPVDRIARDVDRDYILEPDQALEYGIIDRIIESRALQPVPTR